MAYTTLIDTQTLARHLSDPAWVVFDCRFSLADADAGGKAYRFGHIPEARYAHLDHDLSSPITALTGRHPLPDFRVLVRKLGFWGLDNNSQVVVYDDAGGAFAGRMWWLLRCLGHERVAVLNGGIRQWQREGLALTTALPTIEARSFRAYIDDRMWLSADQLRNGLARNAVTLIDARTPERYRGEQEPIDPVAGHVPRAVNRPFQLNLDVSGCFKDATALQGQFKQIAGDRKPEQVVHMCGSGVTACHNLLAMEYAGLKGSKLYAGSWSEWIRNPNRPVATGA
ncbi:MAG: sulfurtransferase [Gammaproteobacteria bacterium]